MSHCLSTARALYRLNASPAPVTDGLVVEPCFGTVAGKHFGMSRNDFREFVFETVRDAPMESLPSNSQQRSIGYVLH
jgi:hypothetical protein